MKEKSITDTMNECVLELNRFTKLINTLKKTPVKRDNNHPFAKYFQVKIK